MIGALPYAPSRPVDLLARAALSPAPQAKEAWTAWVTDYSLDKASWAEVRMLGAVAGRIDQLERDPTIVPRVRGIRKFLWANTQENLRGAYLALKILALRSLPCLVFKGMARIVQNESAAAERLIRDVDALVPLNRAEEAVSALMSEGWTLDGWQPAARENGPLTTHHAWALAKGKAEFDVHHFSNYLNRFAGDDDRLWARARKTSWRGQSVWLPAPSDGLLMALTHGMRHTADGSADWIVDAAAILRAGGINWDDFKSEVAARALEALVSSGLAYLHDVTGQAAPDDVVKSASARIAPVLIDEADVYGRVDWPVEPGDIAKLFLGANLRAHRGAAPNPSVVAQAVISRRHMVFEPSDTLYETIEPPLGLWPDRMIDLHIAVEWPGEEFSASGVVTIEAPGLPFAKFPMTFTQTQGQLHRAAKLTLWSGLLRRRGLDRIWFRLDFKPGSMPRNRVSLLSQWRI